MRKYWVIAAAVALLGAIAAVAYAQLPERTNAYTVGGATSPNKAGSTKKPVPIGLNFSYTVAEQSGLRPAPVEKYSIRFKGVRENSALFPGCRYTKINNDQGTHKCPKGALLGKGRLVAVAGAESNRSDKSITCPLNVEVWNAGRGKASIYVVGGSGAPAGKTTSCPTTTNAALDANFVRVGNEVRLEFGVPLVPFRQQLGTTGTKDDPNAIEVSVVEVSSTVARKTRRVRGKTRGFFEAIGGCVRGTRTISVVFRNEDGKTATAQRKATCRR
ncbi:MAG TPA: hypothetical protein VGW75_00925 [Solirubrobacteraceae bacterium]|jgi:hypothetical protein|nr:hypothetical protein [Solirubrobacteraceae bacterium]